VEADVNGVASPPNNNLPLSAVAITMIVDCFAASVVKNLHKQWQILLLPRRQYQQDSQRTKHLCAVKRLCAIVDAHFIALYSD
jgi:hypothetical protein